MKNIVLLAAVLTLFLHGCCPRQYPREQRVQPGPTAGIGVAGQKAAENEARTSAMMKDIGDVREESAEARAMAADAQRNAEEAALAAQSAAAQAKAAAERAEAAASGARRE